MEREEALKAVTDNIENQTFAQIIRQIEKAPREAASRYGL